MITTKLSTKGRVVIPREVRERHGWLAGLELEVIEAENGVVLRPADDVPRTTAEALGRLVRYDGPALSIEEMDAAIARAAREAR